MKQLLAAIVGLVVAGCAAPPTPAYLAAPADPHRRVPALRGGGVATDVRDFRVVGPRDWERINRDIAPETKGEQR